LITNTNLKPDPNTKKNKTKNNTNNQTADRMGGWLCFTISIIWIGVLTAVIGDVASAFGCSVGLKDSVTAIAFVALGTSVPGRTSNLLSHIFGLFPPLPLFLLFWWIQRFKFKSYNQNQK